MHTFLHSWKCLSIHSRIVTVLSPSSCSLFREYACFFSLDTQSHHDSAIREEKHSTRRMSNRSSGDGPHSHICMSLLVPVSCWLCLASSKLQQMFCGILMRENFPELSKHRILSDISGRGGFRVFPTDWQLIYNHLPSSMYIIRGEIEAWDQ